MGTTPTEVERNWNRLAAQSEGDALIYTDWLRDQGRENEADLLLEEQRGFSDGYGDGYGV